MSPPPMESRTLRLMARPNPTPILCPSRVRLGGGVSKELGVGGSVGGADGHVARRIGHSAQRDALPA